MSKHVDDNLLQAINKVIAFVDSEYKAEQIMRVIKQSVIDNREQQCSADIDKDLEFLGMDTVSEEELAF
tara:strand:+ start:95 stop:301 length:207 start_codon:yes stop_codon:yes gene_type:complete